MLIQSIILAVQNERIKQAVRNIAFLLIILLLIACIVGVFVFASIPFADN